MAARFKKLRVALFLALAALIVFIILSPKNESSPHQSSAAPEAAVPNNSSSLEHAEQQVAHAMQDPSKMRLMECMGVNPWKVKAVGWTPPTKQECAALKAKLGTAADTKAEASVPETPSGEAKTSTSKTPSNEVATLIAEEGKLNEECRGGSGDDKATTKACADRDAIFGEIKARGWCWGHEGQIEADRTWEHCSGSNEGLQK